MNNEWLVYALAAPLLGGLVAVGLWLASRRRGASPYLAFWLDAAALVSACAGVLVSTIFVLMIDPGASLPLLDFTLTAPPIARVMLPATHGAILVALFYSWDADKGDGGGGSIPGVRPRPSSLMALGVATGMATLATGALLIADRTVQSLSLFGIAILASALATSMPQGAAKLKVGEEARADLGGRLAGGLKHLALAALATILLVVGVILLDRYTLTLEKRDLLQLGLSLLSVGLLVRAGAMPFAAPLSDLVRAAPSAAILVLGVAAPLTVGVGLLMLLPVEGGLVAATQTSWVAALGVLLAGIRAFGIAGFGLRNANLGEDNGVERRRTLEIRLPVLIAMSAAAQVGWAFFGVLSGSRMGATGAVLLAANIAIAVPLLVISYQSDERRKTKGVESEDNTNPQSTIREGRRTEPQSAIGLAVGAASLLGLPPFGGFAGIIMVAQTAANTGGLLLMALLLGTLLLGVAWVRVGVEGGGYASLKAMWRTERLLIVVLIASQLGLFALSSQIISPLGAWAGTPWLSAP